MRRTAQARLERVEALRKRLLAGKAGAIRRVLESPDGKALMDALEGEFLFGELLGDTPEATAFNLGAREVVRYLRQLRDFAERTETDAS